jgi:DNA-directed RNA polymerase sigma subunit (sigma70/sigma32)
MRVELDHLGVVHVPVHKQKALRAQLKGTNSTNFESPHVRVTPLSEADSCKSSDDLERDTINQAASDLLYRAMRDLNFRGRDRYIVLAHQGVRDQPRNLRQLAAFLDVSSERVRQLKEVSYDRLREYFEQNQIEMTSDAFTA